MKRKNLENKIENKNSKIFSNNFFSNKINRENTTMKLEISKSYKIGDLTFDSLESANLHILKSIYDSGLEEIIKNPENFITALRTVTNTGNPGKSTPNLGKQPDLSDISKYLKENENITITRLSSTTRKAADWPVYITISPESMPRAFRYTGKVHELYYEILETSIETIITKYSYKL